MQRLFLCVKVIGQLICRCRKNYHSKISISNMLLIAINHHENLTRYYLPGMADLLYIAKIYSDFIIKFLLMAQSPYNFLYLGKDKETIDAYCLCPKSSGQVLGPSYRIWRFTNAYINAPFAFTFHPPDHIIIGLEKTRANGNPCPTLPRLALLLPLW